VDTLNAVAPQLIRTGRVERAGLGAALRPVQFNRDGVGLAVRDIHPGGPADAAGLRRALRKATVFGLSEDPRDVIVAVDGVPTPSIDALYTVLDTRRIGDRATLRVLRTDRWEYAEVPVTLGDRALDRAVRDLPLPAEQSP
jgi:S1-C subfamily serine protease